MGKAAVFGFIGICIIGAIIFFYINSLPIETSNNINNPIPQKSLSNGLTIASWNMQIFGQDKAANTVLMSKYASLISKYDVIFIQEIRDISETSFQKLCESLPGYSCLSSSRAGRSNSKESYGFIYRKGIVAIEFTDYNNANYQQYFERPPLKVIIQIADMFENQTLIKNLTIWANHIKPEDVKNEMGYLEQIVLKDTQLNQPWIVLGDLNFACSYADHNKFKPFDDYFWIIPDSADTTVSSTTSCAYDRIITNFGAADSGIDETITSDMSDHKLVWIKI
jgi:endonuclease/exonuclease/phosphatase family metal-dependent hydrolase